MDLEVKCEDVIRWVATTLTSEERTTGFFGKTPTLAILKALAHQWEVEI